MLLLQHLCHVFQHIVVHQSKCLLALDSTLLFNHFQASLFRRGLTLKTNISLRRTATVLKLPSQMFGLPFLGRAGVECFCFEVAVSPPWWWRGGSVGSGRVGSSKGVGTPGGQNQEDKQEVNKYKYTVIIKNCIIFIISTSVLYLVVFFIIVFTLIVYIKN